MPSPFFNKTYFAKIRVSKGDIDWKIENVWIRDNDSDDEVVLNQSIKLCSLKLIFLSE